MIAALNAFEKALLIGSANKEFIPCAIVAANDFTRTGINAHRTANNSANNPQLVYVLALPTNRGGKKLYVNAVKILVYQADATDYIDNVEVNGDTHLAEVNIITEPTNRTAQGSYTTTLGSPVNASGYDLVTIRINCVVATSADLLFYPPLLEVFYDT